MRLVPVVAVALSAVALATVSGSASGAQGAFRKVVFARGFDSPVLLTYAPGEPRTVYIVEQPGRVLRLRAGRRTVFLDIRDRVDARGGEILPARPVAFEHGDVEARGQRLQARRLGVEHRDLVLLVQGLHDG